MIVCSCGVISDHEILDAVARGMTWRQLVREKKLASTCGRCAVHARLIYERAKAGTYVPLAPAPSAEVALAKQAHGAGAGGLQKER